MSDDLSTNELLRMIGRELQGIRAAAERSTAYLGWLLFLVAVPPLVWLIYWAGTASD